MPVIILWIKMFLRLNSIRNRYGKYLKIITLIEFKIFLKKNEREKINLKSAKVFEKNSMSSARATKRDILEKFRGFHCQVFFPFSGKEKNWLRKGYIFHTPRQIESFIIPHRVFLMNACPLNATVLSLIRDRVARVGL